MAAKRLIEGLWAATRRLTRSLQRPTLGSGCSSRSTPPSGGTTPNPPDRPDGLEEDLPSEERRRIIAEEEFRKGIAEKVDRELTRPGARFLKFLNAPVVIWALSTIVVGFATWAYQRQREDQRRKEEQRALQVRTTNELLFRLSACNTVDSNSTRNDVENLLSAFVAGLRPLHNENRLRNVPDLYLEYCALGGQCSDASKDSVLSFTATVQKDAWQIVGRSPDLPLRDRSVLPRLHDGCKRLESLHEKIHSDARAALVGKE